MTVTPIRSNCQGAVEDDGVRFTPAQKGLVIAVLNEHEEIAGDDVHGFRDLRDELSRDLKQHPFID